MLTTYILLRPLMYISIISCKISYFLPYSPSLPTEMSHFAGKFVFLHREIRKDTYETFIHPLYIHLFVYLDAGGTDHP